MTRVEREVHRASRFYAVVVAAGAAAWCALCVMAAGASALSPERHLEMVSPVFKGGYGVNAVLGVAPDGSRVAFSSLGVFAGAPGSPTLGYGGYVAGLGNDGWGGSILPEGVPGGVAPEVVNGDYSESLGTVLASAMLGPSTGACCWGHANGVLEAAFLLHRTDTPDVPANWEVAGGQILRSVNRSEPQFQPEYSGASGDLCHIVFQSTQPLLAPALGATTELYDLTGGKGCNEGAAPLQVVGLNNAGAALSPSCMVTLGTEEIYKGATASAFNAISADGGTIFFTTCVEGGGHQVFARLGGSRTVEVSRPVDPSQPFDGCGATGEVPCPGAAQRASAEFVGADEAGSVVYFTTSAPLAAGDTDSAVDLYMARIGCRGAGGCVAGEREVTSLTQVSHDPTPGQPAEVQGVLRVAPDGSRAYFVARGVLTSVGNAQGQMPAPGADNLYVWDAKVDAVSFIADLCSGPELSGDRRDARCPTGLEGEPGGTRNDHQLWLTEGLGGQAQTAGGDGAVLVFASFGRLTSDDTDSARDVYRYDAVSGALVRVSGGEGGFDANGNDESEAEIERGHLDGHVTGRYDMDSRAVNEDGSRIVFSTAGRLSPMAINHVRDVYEWHGNDEGGSVSLVSGGQASEGDFGATISPAGADIFFITTQALVPGDSDGSADLYDARLGAAEEEVRTALQPCSGDGCQGPLSSSPALPMPPTVLQAPGENLVAAGVKDTVSKATGKAKCKRAAKRRKVRAKRRGARGCAASRVRWSGRREHSGA